MPRRSFLSTRTHVEPQALKGPRIMYTAKYSLKIEWLSDIVCLCVLPLFDVFGHMPQRSANSRNKGHKNAKKPYFKNKEEI
jgi:hypothetical protein